MFKRGRMRNLAAFGTKSGCFLLKSQMFAAGCRWLHVPPPKLTQRKSNKQPLTPSQLRTAVVPGLHQKLGWAVQTPSL